MTTPIGPTATAATVPPNPTLPTTATDNTHLSSQAFLQLLVAQLKYQDPSKPVDTASFMTETATLTQVQTMEKNAQVSADMLTAQRAQTASSLVGRTLEYTASDGTLKTGIASSATISTANPTLKIGDVIVTLSQIQRVLSAGPPAVP
jgi:flagellar basal-body rod modification protein FlgD